jgi:hypothetical protein
MKAKRSIESDQQLAVDVLTFLAGDMERLGGFLAVTGIEVGDIRTSIADPGFLVAVMDYLMQDDALLVAFAEEARLRPEAVAAAARRIGAGAWERDIP